MREGPIVDVRLIESLFAPNELERWFGTTTLRDDDGAHDGTHISAEAAEEIARRYYRLEE
jgi:hypothetical protein